MNKEVFLRYVEATRDCEQSRLDYAVSRGLRRAKGGRPDSRKLAMLAAACAFTLAMCITVNLKPVQSAARAYCLNRNTVFLGKEAVLGGYVQNIANGINTLVRLWGFSNSR